MNQEELTKRQYKVLKFIQRMLQNSGYPPTLREIGKELGIRSTNGVNDHLKALMRKGYLAKEEGKSRTLKVLVPKAKGLTDFQSPKMSMPVFCDLTLDQVPSPRSQLFAIFLSEKKEMHVFENKPEKKPTLLAQFPLGELGMK